MADEKHFDSKLKKVEINVSFLYPGMILKADGYDEKGNKLIEKKVPISNELIEIIKKKNIKKIYYRRENPIYKKKVSFSMINQEHIEKAINVMDDVEWAIKSNLLKIPVKAVIEVIDDFINDMKENPDACLSLLDLSEYDDYTFTHSTNVAMLVVFLGFSLTMGKDELRALGVSALLHDVGKTLVPKDIINKHEALNESEWDIIKKHPAFGHTILSRNEMLSDDILKGVLWHHEQFMGGGYPYGIKQGEISHFAQCITVADVFDAMTTRSVYHEAKSYSEAFYFILEESGKKFNPLIAQAFLKEIVVKTDEKPLYPIDCYVVLNTGEIGYVVGHSFTEYSLRPIVNIFYDQRRPEKFLKHTQQIDLEHDYNRHIVKRIFDSKFIEGFKQYINKQGFSK